MPALNDLPGPRRFGGNVRFDVMIALRAGRCQSGMMESFMHNAFIVSMLHQEGKGLMRMVGELNECRAREKSRPLNKCANPSLVRMERKARA